MLRTMLPDDIERYRRGTVYRETAIFLMLAGVGIVLAHAIDVLSAGGPNWPALLIRVVWAAGLAFEGVLLRRSTHRNFIAGGAGVVLWSAVLDLLLITVTGGSASPLIGFSYALVVIMPLVAFELIGIGLVGAALLLGGIAVILVADHAPSLALLDLVDAGGGAFFAGWVLATAFQRTRHAEETRHVALAQAFRTNEALVAQLRESMASIRTLRGLLPVCAWCHRVRSDTGYWQQIEAYVTAHSEAQITHGMCPDCAAREFPGLPAADADPSPA
jgi:hypothetical protein